MLLIVDNSRQYYYSPFICTPTRVFKCIKVLSTEQFDQSLTWNIISRKTNAFKLICSVVN